jgi:vitamin B12 transporter
MVPSRIAVLAAVLTFLPAAASALQLALSVDPESTQVSSANRLDETLEQVGNSVTVISRREIELRGQPFVADLLRTVPGLDVVKTGGSGTTSVFIRGNKSEHTLVLLDGVPLNDPSSPGGGYAFENLTTDNVERIEVLRGAQSVMYGSAAVGGSINIITRKGEGTRKLSLYGEIGSQDYKLGRAELNGSTKYVDYSIGGSRLKTGGISAAGSDYGNTERDGYLNNTVSGALGLKPGKDFRLDLTARNSYSNFDLDNSAGVGGDDPNYTGKFNETDLSARGALTLFGGRLVQKSGIALTAQNRKFLNNTDAQHPQSSAQNSSYGRTVKFDYQVIAQLNDNHTATAGVDKQEEAARTEYRSQSQFGPFNTQFNTQKAGIVGVYAEDLMKFWGRLFVSVGGRHDQNDRYGKVDTYRIAPAFLIAETHTKLKASLGTGFKAPSLYQLYSQFGYLNLIPERSTSWDAGFEQDLRDGKMSFGAVYFRNDLRDLIDFNNATNLYYNVGRARTQGYEVTAQVKPTDKVLFKGNYTYTSAVDLSDGASLVRRPRIKLGGDAELHPIEPLSVTVGAVYTGPRVDNDFATFPAKRVKLGGFGLWHLASSYAVNKTLTLTVRVDNLFDKSYSEVQGWGSQGIAGYGGVRLQF